jgi:hypothetical protein
MSVWAPTKAVSDGLVFYYDTGNTKSYRGQPTTNYAVNPTDLYAWTSSANAATLSRDTSILPSPAGGIPLKMVTSGADAYTSTYNSSPWNLAAASAGQTWTASVWVKANRNITNTTCELLILEANSSGTYITAQSVGFYPTTEWQRITYSLTLYSASTAYIQVRLDGPNSYTAGDIVWWDGLQVEQKSYATQFVSGTRTNANGLVDLARNNTIDLTNAGYDSGANITFNGSSNYIDVTSNLGTLSGYTFCHWSRRDAEGRMPIGWRSGPMFYQYGDFSWYYTHGGVAGEYYYPKSVSIPAGTWGFYCITYDGAAVRIYRNGVYEGSQATTGTADWTNGFRIGYWAGGGSYWWQGLISQVLMYNRGLTASEILQNYNAIKGRFGL